MVALNAWNISTRFTQPYQPNGDSPPPPPTITHAHIQQWRACDVMAMMMMMIMANDNLQIVETIGWMRIYMTFCCPVE